MLLSGLFSLTGCNHKPEAPAENYLLTVYPNPVNYEANFEVRNLNNQEYLLQVFDTKGKLLLTKTGQQDQRFSLPFDNQPKGKYQVSLKTQNAVYTKTFLKL
jgi:hypothetical protein